MRNMNDHHVPADSWEWITPAEAGLNENALNALRDTVQGRGCVVRYGRMVYGWGDQRLSRDIASAFKPVLSTYLMLAVQDGRIVSPDEPVARFEPRLKELNGGKDGAITWRHLASQTSGYGLAERPGEAYSYNDFAIALYYDVLTAKVFGLSGTELLRRRLAEPLGFEDVYTHEAFGPHDRPGRLALSVRDLARFGLLYLRGGKWRGQRILRLDLLRMAINSPIPASMPLASGVEAEMLPGQRTIGGSKNITPLGPGCYSFNWWLNRPGPDGKLLYPRLPADLYCASGHGGKRKLWLFPSHDLIIAWNDANVGRETHIDESMDRATELIRAILPE